MEVKKQSKILRKSSSKTELNQQPWLKQRNSISTKNSYRDSALDSLLDDLVIKPKRSCYENKHLGTSFDKKGDKVVTYKDKIFIKQDRQVLYDNKNINIHIYVSPSAITNDQKQKTIILYVHGSQSCCVQALSLMKYIPQEILLACFDLVGCGNNFEADTVSLGFRESAQIQSVVNMLKKQNFKVVVWGRSMGAASALLHGKADFIVADSSYRELKNLFKEIAKNTPMMPGCFVSCVYPCIAPIIVAKIKQRAQYDINYLNIEQAVKKISPQTPIVFLAAKDDKMISCKNSEKLYDVCKSKNKFLRIVQGDHNSKRSDKVLTEIMSMIDKFRLGVL